MSQQRVCPELDVGEEQSVGESRCVGVREEHQALEDECGQEGDQECEHGEEKERPPPRRGRERRGVLGAFGDDGDGQHEDDGCDPEDEQTAQENVAEDRGEKECDQPDGGDSHPGGGLRQRQAQVHDGAEGHQEMQGLREPPGQEPHDEDGVDADGGIGGGRDEADAQNEPRGGMYGVQQEESQEDLVDVLHAIAAPPLAAAGNVFLENLEPAALGPEGPDEDGEAQQDGAQEESSRQSRVSHHARSAVEADAHHDDWSVGGTCLRRWGKNKSCPQNDQEGPNLRRVLGLTAAVRDQLMCLSAKSRIIMAHIQTLAWYRCCRLAAGGLTD